MLLQQWREAIEETKKKILLLQELETAEVPEFGEDDMKVDIAIAIDFSLETEAGYRHFCDSSFENCVHWKASTELACEFNQAVFERALVSHGMN